MCPINMCLPLLRWEMRLVRARLLSTGSRTVYLFSPTSPTRTHSHQFLNPWQSNNMCSTWWILCRRRMSFCTHAHVFQHAHLVPQELSCGVVHLPEIWDTPTQHVSPFTKMCDACFIGTLPFARFETRVVRACLFFSSLATEKLLD
jgi:hypothetical protein